MFAGVRLWHHTLGSAKPVMPQPSTAKIFDGMGVEGFSQTWVLRPYAELDVWTSLLFSIYNFIEA